jgi:predicted dinucleotide-binding enzyme
MGQYRIRLLDSGGMNIAIQLLDCSDDHGAMAMAKSLVEGGGIAHVWAGDRNVGQIFLPLPTSEK